MKPSISKGAVWRTGLLLSAAATLTACSGGGGGGSASVSPPADPPPPVSVIDMFGAGFGSLFRASANTEARRPTSSDIVAVSLTTQPIDF